MIEGLDEISDLLRLYKHKESVYLHGPDESAPPDLVKAIQELYVDIFEYQVRLICFLARKWSRIGIYGTMRLDYWKSMRKQIRDSNENFKKYGVALSEEKARLDYKNESSCIEQSVGIQKRVFDTFEASRTQRQKERRDNIEAQLLETLASDYKSDKDLVPARVPGTCEWFFEDERFLNWRSNKSLSLLWVSAGPGCGKSVLSRALIDERRVCSSFMTSSVYYFFFKDGQERRTHGAHALSAILHQLFETTNLISHAVPSYQNYGKTLRDNFSELWDLLIKSAKDQEAGEIICILDALDECEENKRNELINKLIDFALQTDLQEQLPFSLKFLVTSRPYDTIEEQFKSLSGASTYLRFDGDEKSQKISQEINLVIDAEIPNITGGFNDEDRQCISDRLRMMNNRTYLLLYLTIDIIKRSRSNYRKASNIKNLLSNLPSKFSDAYERILDKSSDKELAQTLLQIIVAATRPLSLTEANIALALAIQQGCCRSHETLDLWPLQNVKSFVQNICGLFVSVHDEKLSLIHQTAREFLIEKKGSSGIHPYEWQGCFDLATTHGTMSKICLCYLQFDDFAEPIHHNEPQNSYQYSQETHHQTEARNKFYPLFDYAALNWMTHYNSQHSGSAKESLASAQTLCNHLLARKFNWLQVYLSSNREWLIFPEWTNFGIASFFGLTYVVEKFLNEETDFNTLGGIRTALHMASYAGHAVVVRMLLDKGANMNAKEVDQTALQLASGNGHEKAVQVLLQYGADANNKDAYSTALELASYAGHDKVVRFLLEKGANPNREGERGSALYLASSKGREEVIRILLENGADVNAQSENYSSALQMAASRGDDKVVRILLENGADINIRDKDHDSALHWASFEGDERVVQILLENGADVNARAKDHDSALHTASRGGHDKVVQMLVENGADVNAQNKNHESALQMASFKGYSQVMRLLFENGADVGRRDMQGRYPIHLASARGYKALVESFSGRMSDLKIIDEQGRNCLHHAACGGFADLVYWLIGKGFDPNAADRDGWTPLHWAAKNGSLDTVETLIRAGAISTIEAIKGWTPYSVATFHHNSLEILLNVTVSSEPTQSGLSTDNVAESLAAAIGSASPGTLQYNKCHGCLLVSFGLSKIYQFLRLMKTACNWYTLLLFAVSISRLLFQMQCIFEQNSCWSHF